MVIFKKQWQVVTPINSSFIAGKGVALSLDIWPSRKALKCLLQNILLMLDLLHHKRNPPIKTAVDVSIKKKIKIIAWEKNDTLRYFYPGITIMKL